MDYQELKELEASDATLEELLGEIPEQDREELLQDLENVSPQQALEILMSQMDSRGNAVSRPVPEEETEVDPEEQMPLAPGALSEEEKAFFFQPDSETEGVENFPQESPEGFSFEDVVVDPVIRDTRRLLYFNLAGLCTLLCIMTLVAWLQMDGNRQARSGLGMIQSLREQKAFEGASSSERNWLTDLVDLSAEEQQKVLDEKLASPMLSKKEKIFTLYLQASLCFRQGDYAKGKDLIVQGLKMEQESEE